MVKTSTVAAVAALLCSLAVTTLAQPYPVPDPNASLYDCKLKGLNVGDTCSNVAYYYDPVCYSQSELCRRAVIPSTSRVRASCGARHKSCAQGCA